VTSETNESEEVYQLYDLTDDETVEEASTGDLTEKPVGAEVTESRTVTADEQSPETDGVTAQPENTAEKSHGDPDTADKASTGDLTEKPVGVEVTESRAVTADGRTGEQSPETDRVTAQPENTAEKPHEDKDNKDTRESQSNVDGEATHKASTELIIESEKEDDKPENEEKGETTHDSDQVDKGPE